MTMENIPTDEHLEWLTGELKKAAAQDEHFRRWLLLKIRHLDLLCRKALLKAQGKTAWKD